MLGFGATSGGLAYLIKPVFDDVLIQNQNLAQVAVLIIVIYIAKGTFSYFSTYLMSWVGQRTVMDLRNVLYQHVIRQSVSFFKSQSTGTLISHITNDVEKIQQAVSGAMGDLLMQTFALLGYGALVFYYDWKLAIFCFVIAPLAVYPLVTLGRKLRRRTDTGLERWRDITNVLHETISGSRIVKAFRMEASETKRFVEATDGLFRTNMRITRVISMMPPIMELVGGVGMAAAIWYGSNRIAASTMTTGEFSSFIGRGTVHGHAGRLCRAWWAGALSDRWPGPAAVGAGGGRRAGRGCPGRAARGLAGRPATPVGFARAAP